MDNSDVGVESIAASTAMATQEDDGRIVITAEEIAGVIAVRTADVLNQVPGLKVGDTSVAIHGSYKVKVLMDGRPINEPTSSHGGVKWDMHPTAKSVLLCPPTTWEKRRDTVARRIILRPIRGESPG